YDYLNNIVLQSMDISVAVSGIRNLILENDLGVLNPAKPFYPFGPVPKKGSKFYIGSNEAFQKSLSNVTLDVSWGDLPEENFEDYYLEYNNHIDIKNNCYFKATLAMLSDGKWKTETTIDHQGKEKIQQKKLFNSIASGIGKTRSFFYEKETKRPSATISFNRFHVGLQYGFMKMELLTSFLHSLYPTVLASAVKPNPDIATIPNVPYTPLITELKLNYTASEFIDYKQLKTDNFSGRIEQLFHIAPFGQVEFFPVSKAPFQTKKIISQSLLTDFPVSVDNKLTAEGTLYIGIDKLKPPQNLSILFQVAESSAAPELEPPKVFWSYMENNCWVAFSEAEILADKTNGLLTSGIINFAVPEQITDNNTILPKGLHWIKASVENNSRGIT
ncbi:MAG: hypothetical protein KAI17_14685, partial [Thiotrichaceae bacterium]|nr:hypothetical protein [Thiotrichaceae bacterium]